MTNEPTTLSETIKIIKGQHAGKEAYVVQYDWFANSIKARLKKDDPKTAVMVTFDDAVFLKEKT